ncbi:MAG: beta-1,4-glucosyltransferase [Kiritimatiellia bacterium]
MQFIDTSHVNDPIIRSLTLLDEKDTPLFLEEITQTDVPISLGFVNQHAYNLIHNNNAIADNFFALTYRLRDGSGVSIACKYNACNPGANLNGTDFIPLLIHHILNTAREVNLFIFGTQEPWLTKGGEKLLSAKPFIGIDGFLESNVYVEALEDNIKTSQLTLVILAMGMPKQEKLAQEIVATVDGPVIIVCGGAVVDFCAGRFSRAPAIFRQFGLEWLYRLCLEPKRLFRRYVLGVPLFFYYMLKNK